MCRAGGRGEILCVYRTAAATRDMDCSGSEAAKRPRGESGLGDVVVGVEARKMVMPMVATRARAEATVMETTRTTTETTAAAMALESACAVLRRAS